MKAPFSSFYVRLSVLFLALLLLAGAVYVGIAVRSSIDFVQEADQRMNVNLASSIGAEIAPLVEDSIHTADMEKLLHYLMVMNPHIEIYLLDSSGTILAFFADHDKTLQRQRVSLGPIKQFLSDEQTPSLVGDDPRSTDREKPFTAAPVRLKGNAPGYVYVILGGEQYDRASAAIKSQFLTSTIAQGLVITLVFTGVLGLILFFIMTRRLKRVTEVVTDFGDGRLEERLEDSAQDDFGKLAREFNRMADTIVRNMAELKRSDELRRELVANVSHDLRTPLATMQGYLETMQMKRENISPEELERYMSIGLRNTRYLSNLVEELFELSKLNAEQARPAKEPFSISDLIQDILLKFKSAAEAKSVTLDCSYKGDIPLVAGDIGMIERALSNLVDNAIRYAPEKARVTVELIPRASHVRVKVSDSGPGIAEEDVPFIFLPYYRGKRTRDLDSQGTGLGLAITKRIIELHDSDIHVATEPDHGTTFYFDLARA
ncbi:MAG: ATP-binding protein [Rudaea sp.]